LKLKGFKGVGEKKLQQYGEIMLDAIKDYCQTGSLEINNLSHLQT